MLFVVVLAMRAVSRQNGRTYRNSLQGLYFANMASKSANYCAASAESPTGLLILARVALGDCHKLFAADEKIKKPPKGFHCVHGVGDTTPNPEQYITRDDGVVIPAGEGVARPCDASVRKKKSALLYDEFIVYDESQVKIEFLLRVQFKFKK